VEKSSQKIWANSVFKKVQKVFKTIAQKFVHFGHPEQHSAWQNKFVSFKSLSCRGLRYVDIKRFYKFLHQHFLAKKSRFLLKLLKDSAKI
jgi:hypothetical protein